jgi:DNA-binding NtrC family response regulator
MRKYLVIRDPDMIAEDLRSRMLRRPGLGMGSPATKSTAVSVAETEETTTPGAPILKRVKWAKEQAETEAILTALNSTKWNRKQAAQLLNTDYKALLYKMKKLSIEP